MAITLNLGKLRLDWRGDYTPSTAYVANDVVTYRQQQWICTQPTTTASFTASRAGTNLVVSALTPIAQNVQITNTAAGTTVTVLSTQGLQTGNTFVVSGNAGGGLTATTYYVGAVLSNTTLTLSTTYANAIAGTYITFTANTFGSTSATNLQMTGTMFTAYGTLASGQILGGTNTPLVVTSATGNGTTVTLTFATQPAIPFATGTIINVNGITPFGYNGNYIVTGGTITTVTYANTTTATLTQSGYVSSAASNTTIVSQTSGTTGGVGTYVVSSSATVASTSFITLTSSLPVVGSSYWTAFTSLFNNMGNWTSGTTYAVGDVVLYSTPTNLASLPSSIAGNYNLSRTVVQAYYCITAHTGSSTGTIITPIDPGYWQPVNRKGILGSQTAPSSLTGNYNLGVYSNQNYTALVLPNRGIAFDNSTQYYGGTTGKNTTDSPTMGFVSGNGQAMSWNQDINGSGGMLGQHNYAQTSLTFPLYDYWRSASVALGSGVHTTPDGNIPRIIQWEKCYDRNLVLMNSGEIFAWGYNGNGELGDGSTTNRNFPVRVGGPLASIYNTTTPTVGGSGNYTAGHALFNTRIKRISQSGACGYGGSGGHCLALDENGQVWAWGANPYGQLGIGAINAALNTTSTSWPQPIPKSAFATGQNPSGQNVVAIWACGSGTGGTAYSWSYAVTQDGNLWAWGMNAAGQLGVGDTNPRYIPTIINNVASAGLTFGGVTTGNIIKIQVLDNASAAGTKGCAAILTSTGLVYVAGANGSGWMGFGTGTVNVWTNIGGGPGTTVNSVCRDMWLYGSGGDYASFMMRDSVTGYCWTAGYNNAGQLGYSGSGTASSNVFTISKMNIAGTTYNLYGVKQLAFAAFGAQVSATVILDNGISLSIGYNQYGTTSIGFANSVSPYGTVNTDPNGIEIITSYVWQPVRTPPGMQGNMADAMGFCYSTAGFAWLMWLNKDGRVMIAGNGQNPGGAQFGNAWGQFHAAWDSINAESMSIPLTD